MADRESNFANNWSSTLTAEMGPTALTATVAATSDAPASPCYLLLDPTDDTKREYVWFDGTFTGTDFVTGSTGNRYLAGSAAASGITHDVGAEVWAVTAAQALEDLHDRVSAVDAAAVGDHNHDGSYAAVSHTHGTAGGPLATLILTSSSANSATTSWTDLFAGAAEVTFTAPASGAVYVELEAYSNVADGYNWGLRVGSTLVGSCKVADIAMYGRLRGAIQLTGLTPAANYTYKWADKADTNYQGTAFASSSVGPAVMRVWAA